MTLLKYQVEPLMIVTVCFGGRGGEVNVFNNSLKGCIFGGCLSEEAII